MQFKLVRKQSVCTFAAAVAALASACAVAQGAIGLDINSFRIISDGFSVESRCGHLPEKYREELGTHAAYAETAAVRTHGAAAVREVRKADTSILACGEATQAIVKAALAEGRRFENNFAAHEAKQKASRGRLSARQQRIVTRQQRRQKKRTGFFTVQRRSTTVSQHSAGDDLQRFQSQLHAYYVERRCQYLRPGKAQKFWKMINTRHAALSAAYDEQSLSQSNAHARAAAEKTSCSSRARRFVAGNMRALASDL